MKKKHEKVKRFKQSQQKDISFAKENIVTEYRYSFFFFSFKVIAIEPQTLINSGTWEESSSLQMPL